MSDMMKSLIAYLWEEGDARDEARAEAGLGLVLALALAAEFSAGDGGEGVAGVAVGNEAGGRRTE